MTDNKYKLRYLPLFYEDLQQVVPYIAEKLQNVKAVNDLLDEAGNGDIRQVAYGGNV